MIFLQQVEREIKIIYKAAHIEAGIAYGLGKKCYAIGEYEATDTLYNIFEEIFLTEKELEEFLSKYN